MLACLFALVAGTMASRSLAQTTHFIPAANRVDMVHDAARHLLYITNGDSVLRYDLVAGVFLTPFQLGGQLKGIDLSPDGNTLLVADKSYTGDLTSYPAVGTIWIDVVNLTTGASRKALFPRSFYEDGTFTVAFGADGRALVTSSFGGSGTVPMRLYDPTTDTATTVATVTQDTMLAASADRNVIGFAESNNSGGPFGTYKVSDGTVAGNSYVNGTGWFNYEIGVSRNGSQLAIPTYGGTFFYDAHLARNSAVIGTYAGAQPIGVVYSPVADRVYFPLATTSQIRAYDTTTFQQVAAYDFGDTFQSNGNFAFVNGRLKMSRDGALLFATVTGGVRYLDMGEPVANPQTLHTPAGTPKAVTLTGSVPGGGALTFQVATSPQHGVLTGSAPNLTYTPNANFQGQDSFTFQSVLGSRPSAPATVTIQVGALTHILWTNPNGVATVWNVAADGSHVERSFGPYTDNSVANALLTQWNATALATGPDGVSHLLWNNQDGRVMLWSLDDDGNFTLAGYGPYTDRSPRNRWTATAVSVGPDNITHLLWNNTDHRVMLWNVASDFSFTLAGYGPYTDASVSSDPGNLWSATALATGPDGLTRILWNNVDHRVMLWKVDSSFNFTLAGYGPYTDNYVDNNPANLWSATAISVGPDNITHLLWNNADSRVMLWSVDSAFNFSLAGYGPYTDDYVNNDPNNLWSATALATGRDNVSRLLWNNVDHRVMLWNVDSAFNFGVTGYGPYSGLTAIAISTGQ